MAKRLFDFVVALAGLILLAPVFVLIAVAIKLDSAGPVFFLGQRIGLHGRPFSLYKFRSMVANAAQYGPGITASGDPRVTKVGHILRRTKLDELPQLINVIRGDMSLVGPRPEDPRYVTLYTPEQRQVLRVRPGITSMASIKYRHEEAMLSQGDWHEVYIHKVMPEKIALDLAYLEKQSFWQDIGILVSTVLAVLR